MNNNVTALYIVGAGRSGSTIMDTVIGNHDSIESVGELINAPRAWDNSDEYCACGAQAGECCFWKEVRKTWRMIVPDLPNNSEWRTVQAKFERGRYLLNVICYGNWKSRQFQLYARGVSGLYRAIQEVSGKQVIVDSSKNPVRALALSFISDIDLKILHLVRDGRGVACSWKKSYQKDAMHGIQRDLQSRSVSRSAISWWRMNWLSEVVARQYAYTNVKRVRYEDFVADPRKVLDDVGKLMNMDFDNTIKMLDDDRELKVGHTIAGNRLRMASKVKLKADIKWQDELTVSEKRIFWLIAGRMAKRYGYVA